MGFFAGKTKVVDLGGGNTVTLRGLTFGETFDARSAIAVNGIADHVALQVEMMVRSVVSWSGPDFEGEPVTPENVRRLPLAIGQRLMEESDALLKQSDEEKN